MMVHVDTEVPIPQDYRELGVYDNFWVADNEFRFFCWVSDCYAERSFADALLETVVVDENIFGSYQVPLTWSIMGLI